MFWSSGRRKIMCSEEKPEYWKQFLWRGPRWRLTRQCCYFPSFNCGFKSNVWSILTGISAVYQFVQLSATWVLEGLNDKALVLILTLFLAPASQISKSEVRSLNMAFKHNGSENVAFTLMMSLIFIIHRAGGASVTGNKEQILGKYSRIQIRMCVNR